MRQLVGAILGAWMMSSAVFGVSGGAPVSTEVAPMALPGDLVSRLDDPELQSLTLSLPEGSAAVVIQPDTGEGLSQGWIEAVDTQGRSLVRQEHMAGLAVAMGNESDRIRGLGLPENDPLVIMVPAGTKRVEIEGQFYDEAGDPRGNGSIRCYDSEGRLLHEETELVLDLFLF